MRILAPLLPLALLPACGSDPDPAPGGVTPEEQAALNDAAEMLGPEILSATGEIHTREMDVSECTSKP